jgi:ferredoxin-NADP reductase
VARAAVPGRLSWRVATVKETRNETATARTLLLDVPGWPGHLPGQHVAVKLTAADGYSAQRDYSVAGPPQDGRVELTVQRLDDGEVSSYLAGVAEPGDQFEVRGPIGGWFAWRAADPRPLLLLAGGSGIVPLMSMIRTHAQARSQAPVRLIYSARTPADVIYSTELTERERVSPLTVTYLYTRAAPPGAAPAGGAPGARGIGRLFARHHAASAPGQLPPLAPPAEATEGNLLVPRVFAGRISAGVVAAAFPPAENPAIFVCGPSGFVETAADLLVKAGHPPGSIKTERFGPT